MRNELRADEARFTLTRFEVTVLATQHEIDEVAERIERAYRGHRPGWRGGCSSSRVWQVAAEALLEISATDPSLPSDPELFVLAQPLNPPYPDPWSELTGPDCLRHYRRCVRGIVRGLRRELTAEVRVAEERIVAGRPIGRVLNKPGRAISPLGRYIVARRAGRTALARRFLTDVIAQHHSCPLYRQATAGLLPPESYPVSEKTERVLGLPSNAFSAPTATVPWN